MRVAVYSRTLNQEQIPYAKELFSSLKKANAKVFAHLNTENYLDKDEFHGVESFGEDLPKDIDFLVSLGGDGTMLDCLGFMHSKTIPVIGINLGRLGFLASVPKENIGECVSALSNSNYTLEDRAVLNVKTSSSENQLFALNECSIIAKGRSTIIGIKARLDGNYLNTYWADGLIVCTPTGSTGYSLSCGGPIVTPSAESFVITPIAPHNLNVRPMVVRDDSLLELEILAREGAFLLNTDSRSVALDAGSTISIRKAKLHFRLIKLESDSFIQALRSKLKWGEDLRTKGE